MGDYEGEVRLAEGKATGSSTVGQTNSRFCPHGASICDGNPKRRTIALAIRESLESRFGDDQAACRNASIAPGDLAGSCDGNKGDGRPIDFERACRRRQL